MYVPFVFWFCNFLYQAMRELRQRPEEIGSRVTTQDMDEWRYQLEVFLTEQLGEEAKEKIEKMANSKWQRLATFDLLCASDWQLVVVSGYGFNMSRLIHGNT